ncbi:uncharacterized protein LOC105212143 [Zeugodacus cucurbitae]|uniref:uncharacterized protein LOC105212143 n=1 Tax=Zeugodacus cucurbitae TaxID=28588 RepID=UPI000596A10D|nr:uncharacterized protein LOC105212143 [Zeugodacus cucurbitae]
MPLVKIIGAHPTTSAAAAAAIEAATHNRRFTDDIPAEAPKKIQLPDVKIDDDDDDLHILNTVPLWKDETPEGVLAMRKIHTDYIVAVHLHALGFLVLGITQWILLSKIEAVVHFVRGHYHLALLPFALGFIMLIILIFFYEFITMDRHITLFYTYVVIMLQLCCVPMALPICAAHWSQSLISGFILVIVIVIGIIISHSKRDYYIYKPDFILAWTCRFFLISSMGIIVGISLPTPYFDVIMTLTMAFFVSLFTFMCAKAISSAEFVWLDDYGPHMYGSMIFISYMTLFAMGILLLEELKEAAK